MTFECACRVWQGEVGTDHYRVARRAWNGEKQIRVDSQGDLLVWTWTRTPGPWIPTREDLTATDWMPWLWRRPTNLYTLRDALAFGGVGLASGSPRYVPRYTLQTLDVSQRLRSVYNSVYQQELGFTAIDYRPTHQEMISEDWVPWVGLTPKYMD